MATWLGDVAAGVTWPPPWRAFRKEHPLEAEALKVVWDTPPLLNNAVIVRDDLPVSVTERVRELLLALDGTPAGQAIRAAWEPAVSMRPMTPAMRR